MPANADLTPRPKELPAWDSFTADQKKILSREMEVGDAAHMCLSDAQQFRIILAAQGFDCVSDGYRSEVTGMTLVFKLAPPAEPQLSFDI